jgi:AcrR family transcriptional regulator
MAILKSNRAGVQTRNAILGAARRLFSMHGFHATSTSDICETAGVAKGAFFHHFPSKEELVLQLVALVEAEYEEQLFRPSLAVEPAGARICWLLDKLAALNFEPGWHNCRLLLVLAQEAREFDDPSGRAVHRIQARLLNTLQSLAAEAQAAGSVPAEWSAAACAQVAWNGLMGALQARCAGLELIDLQEFTGILKRLLVKPG